MKKVFLILTVILVSAVMWQCTQEEDVYMDEQIEVNVDLEKIIHLTTPPPDDQAGEGGGIPSNATKRCRINFSCEWICYIEIWTTPDGTIYEKTGHPAGHSTVKSRGTSTPWSYWCDLYAGNPT